MISRKKAALAAMLLLALFVSGCGAKGVTQGVGPSTRVRISGSGTALPLLRILTRAYEDKSISFVYLPGLHSGGGIKGVANGDLEMGATSRDLDTTETALGLQYTVLSQDGLVIAVNPSVSVNGLTSQQVRDIYSGKITNWKQVGGPDLRIHVLDRNEDESAKIILRKYVLGKLGTPEETKVTGSAIKLYYEPDMVEALTSTQGSIGYFSLGYGLSENIPVKMLELDGVAPTVENVANGSYKVIRPLGMVVGNRADRKVTEFVKWATGPEAAAIMKEHGYAPAGR